MAELHESILRSFRRRYLKRGFREGKSPMPTYRPDVFAQRISKRGVVIEEVIAEAEIKSTLFSNHTAEQLVLMDEYIIHQKKKKIPVKGFLIVPKGKDTLHIATSLKSSFPEALFTIVQP